MTETEDSSTGRNRPEGASAITSLDTRLLHQGLEDILVHFLGPIATVIRDDAYQVLEEPIKGPEDYGKLIACLTDEIEDHQDALRFKQQASDLLAGLVSH